MSSLYSSLPHRTYTLRAFNNEARELERKNDLDGLLQFILTGEVDGNQAVLDPIRNALEEGHPVHSTRDYDSVLTTQESIIVTCSICVYPVPNPADDLTTSVHLTYPITNGDVSSASSNRLDRQVTYHICRP